MIALMINAAVRAIVLAGIVGAALKLFRVRNPHALLSAWTCVLLASLAMPLALQWSPVAIPVTVRVPPVQATAASTAVSIAPTATVEKAAAAVSIAVSNGTIPATNSLNLITNVYLAIAGVMLIRLMVGVARTALLVHRAQKVH